MAIAFVGGGVANGNAATSSAVTITSTTGGVGHDLFVAVSLATTSATVTSITGASFKLVAVNTANSVRTELWAATDIAAGITSVTVNFGSSKFSIAVAEYSGIAQWGVLNFLTSGTSVSPAATQTLVKVGSYLLLAAGLNANASTFAAGTNTTIDENGGQGSQSGASGTKCNVCLARNTSTSAAALAQTAVATTITSSTWNVVALELCPTADTLATTYGVQAAQCHIASGDSFTTAQLALRKTVSLHDLLLVCSQSHTATLTDAIADTDVNSWNSIGTQAASGSVFSGSMSYAFNTVAGSATAWDQVKNTGATAVPVKFLVTEYANLFITAALDKTAKAGGSSTTPSSGATAALVQLKELVVSFVACETAAGSITAGTNFTLMQTSGQAGNEYLLGNAGATQTGSFTLGSTGTWACIVAGLIATPFVNDDDMVHTQSMWRDWRAFQSDEMENQWIGPRVPTPPLADPARFALASEEITVGDVMDFGFATAPTFTDESEPYQVVAVAIAPTMEDLDVARVVTPPPVAPNIGLDDIENIFKPIELWDKFQNKTDLDEPGEIGPPAFAIQDDDPAAFVDWRAFQLVDEEQTRDTDLLAAPAIQDDDPAAFVDWRKVQPDDDTYNTRDTDFLAPTTFQEEPIERYVGWCNLQLIDEEQTRDTNLLAAPAFQDEISERNADWRALLPVDEEQTKDTDLLAPPAPPDEISERNNDWLALQPDEGLVEKTPTPIVIVTTAADDIEAHGRIPDVIKLQPEDDPAQTPAPPTANDDGLIERPADWRAVYDYIPETDQPGQLGAPAFAIQDDETPKFTGLTWLYDHTSETDEPGGLAAPPASIQEEFAESKNVDWIARQFEDTDTGTVTPVPPVTFQEEPIEKYAGWLALQYEDTDTNLVVPPTPFSVQEEFTERNVDYRTLQYDDMDTNRVATPNPPTVFQEEPIEKYVGWLAIQYEDTDTQSIKTPTPPVTEQDEISERYVDWQQAFQSEETQSSSAPTPPIVQQFEESEQKNVSWQALHEDGVESGKTPPPPPPAVNQGWDDLELSVHAQDTVLQYHEDDLRTLPPTPISIQEEFVEQKNTDYRALQPEDETFNAAAPTPPVSFQEEPIEKQVDWSSSRWEEEAQLQDSDLLAPPTIQEEPIEKYSGWTALQPEDETLRDSAPTPPVSFQEEPIEKLSDWRQPFQEDAETQRALPPTPPEPEPETADDFEPQTQIIMWRSGDQIVDDALAPTPPVTFQDEPIEKYVGWQQIFHADEETQRGSAPTPPTANDDGLTEKSVDWHANQHEDVDTNSSAAPTPPTTFQEEPIEKQVDWTARQPEDDSYNAERPDAFAPTANDAEQPGATPVPTLVDEALAAEQIPPVPPFVVTEGRDDQESMSRTGDLQFVYTEEENRFSAPTPPTTQQFEESEQKNVDWQVKQQEDTETQRGSAPTPPITQQDEISERPLPPTVLQPEDDTRFLPPTPPFGQPDIFTEQWVDWRQLIVEDDLSTNVPTPPFALQDQADDSLWRGLSFLAIEDDWSATAPRPPFALQDQADDSLWRGIQTPLIEDDLNSRAPTPPFALQDAEDTLWRGINMPLVEDDWLMGTPAPPPAQDELPERPLPPTVQFDEVLGSEKTPPPPVIIFTAADDLEQQKNVDWQVKQQEDTESQRTAAPTPPFAIQFEESEQKNVDYVARQYEDVETQRGSAPTPPFAIQFEESEQKNVDYVARQYEDTETQQTQPAPVPPTQIDEISERYVDWLQPWHEDVETQRVLPPTPPTADDFDHSQMLQYIPMAIPFDEADTNPFPPPPPPTHIGAGRDDEELQMYREFTGPYFEAIQEQWIWFSGFIYPTSVIGSGNILETSGSGSVTPVSGSGQITETGGSGQITEVTGAGEVDPIEGEGKVN